MKEQIKSLVETLLGPVFNQVDKGVRHFVENRVLEYTVELYNRSKYIKTILYQNPVDLSRIYQPLFLESKEVLIRISTSNIAELFGQHQFISVIGGAGSGKSILVRKLILDAIDKGFRIPIKLDLRLLNEYEDSIFNYVKKEIIELEKIAVNEEFVERFLDSGKFVFFFDGYDEIVIGKKNELTEDINKFVRRYNKNYYLITSRPFTYIESLPLFFNFYLSEFKPDEVESFIYRQLGDRKKQVGAKMIEAIGEKENEVYASFLKNPLLLTMFMKSFEYYADIPRMFSEFHRQVFDTLFNIHDASSKLGFVREKTSQLSKAEFEDILEFFSFYSYFKRKTDFSKDFVETALDKFKAKRSHFKFDNNALIYDLKVVLGLFVEDGLEQYTFPHISFQIYFASRYIKELGEEAKPEFYKRLKDRTIRFLDIQDLNSFLFILKELDQDSLTRHFTIPVLDSWEQVIGQSTNGQGGDYSELIRIFSFNFEMTDFFFDLNLQRDDEAYGALRDFHNLKPERAEIMTELFDLEDQVVLEELSESQYNEQRNLHMNDRILPFMQKFADTSKVLRNSIAESLKGESRNHLDLMDDFLD